MPRQIVIALSIARPLLEGLTAHPFVGRVQGCFERACNLVDDSGQMITVALPEVGQGPFSVVIPGTSGMFGLLANNQPALAEANFLNMGLWQIDLRLARLWEARLPYPGQPVQLTPALAQIMAPYAAWPHPETLTPLAQKLYRQAAIAATGLTQALTEYSPAYGTSPPVSFGDQPSVVVGLSTAIEQLAGLGEGLTPAGDDYLVGVMAALWLKGKANWLPQIAAIAAPRTTRLSAAFLQAAGRGEFSQPWHYLAQALAAANTAALEKAMEELIAVGASSGRVGLAGFATTILRQNIKA